MASRGVLVDKDRLDALRLKRGWTQQFLADRAGLAPRTLTKIGQGKVCDPTTLALLAKALNVDPELLLTPEDPPDITAPAPSANGHASGAPLLGHGERHVGPPQDEDWPFLVEQCWKVIDFRNAVPKLTDVAFPPPPQPAAKKPRKGKPTPAEAHATPSPQRAVELRDHYRLRRTRVEGQPLVFSYLTWGEAIECVAKPDTCQWQRVAVRPGDLVHSDKHWQIHAELPTGDPGSYHDLGPIHLRYVDAFHGPGQQWWQVRVTYPTEMLLVQILLADSQRANTVAGYFAPPGALEFRPLLDNPPQLLNDGSMAMWLLRWPEEGTFYKLTWEWK